MATFSRKESAEWAIAVNTEVDKLHDGANKALADGARRGFPAPPGDVLGAILAAGQETKAKLAAVNGKIYDSGRERLFQVDEFAIKVLVRIAKLSFEAYREQIMNALALEEAQARAATERKKADIDRLNTETEARMASVIRAKAEMEQSIITYKEQLIAAERESQAAELILINAQLETAEKKLEIIDSIYQVLAAEELVLAAERRRAATLELLLEAQEVVAATKKEMIPFYLEKAAARQQLAVAVTKEAAAKEDLERLGYDRLELKRTEENVAHQLREAEEEHELAQQARIRAEKATELARTQLRRLLIEYGNQVKRELLDLKEQLAKDGVDFKLSVSLAKAKLGIEDDIALVEHDRSIVTEELANLLANMIAQAQDQARTIGASAHTITQVQAFDVSTRRRILKG